MALYGVLVDVAFWAHVRQHRGGGDSFTREDALDAIADLMIDDARQRRARARRRSDRLWPTRRKR